MSITIDTNASKTSSSSTFPLFATDTGPFTRVAPILTPDEFKRQYLFAIPLKNPLTKQELNNEDLKAFINRAMINAEMALQITILETQHTVKLPYDRPLTNYYNFLEIPIRPISRLDALTIETADQQNVFVFPANIIETRNLHLGMLTIGLSASPTAIPATLLSAVSPNGGGVLILSNFLMQRTQPAFFKVICTAGFSSNAIPSPINNYIATCAAIDVISTVGPLFRINSASMNMDGIGQSVSGSGPQVFAQRMNDLMAKKADLEKNIKGYYYSAVKLLNI